MAGQFQSDKPGLKANFIGGSFGGKGGMQNNDGNDRTPPMGTIFTTAGSRPANATNGSNMGTKAHFLGGTATQTGGKPQMGSNDPLAKTKKLPL